MVEINKYHGELLNYTNPILVLAVPYQVEDYSGELYAALG